MVRTTGLVVGATDPLDNMLRLGNGSRGPAVGAWSDRRLEARVLNSVRVVIGKQILMLGSISALAVAGCGGGGASSLNLGAATSISRDGNSGSATAKAFKYTTAIISVRQAGAHDLKDEAVLGNTPKNDIAFYVTQRVSGVQTSYAGWLPESPDVYGSSGSQATPLETGTDLHECLENKPASSFGPGKSFETCDVYLLPPGDHVSKVVLAAEGPGQNDVTWKVG